VLGVGDEAPFTGLPIEWGEKLWSGDSAGEAPMGANVAAMWKYGLGSRGWRE